MSEKIDLSNPKERAVLDLLALAITADGEVAEEEIALVVEQLQSMLALPEDDAAFAGQIRACLDATVAEIERVGSEPILARALPQVDTMDERAMLFALITAVMCADGAVTLSETAFLSDLRVKFDMSEALALQGVAAVSAQMAQQRAGAGCCKSCG